MSATNNRRFMGSARKLIRELRLDSLLHMDSDKIRSAENTIAAFVHEITAYAVEECVKQESKAGSRLSAMRLLRAIPDKHESNEVPLDIALSLMKPDELERLKRYAKMYIEKYGEKHRKEEEDKKDQRNTQFTGYTQALVAHILKINDLNESKKIMAQHFYDFAEDTIRQIADCLGIDNPQEFAKAMLQDVPDKRPE